jgi:hypothetical protein
MKNGQIGVGRHSSCDVTIDDRAVSMRQTLLLVLWWRAFIVIWCLCHGGCWMEYLI